MRPRSGRGSLPWVRRDPHSGTGSPRNLSFASTIRDPLTTNLDGRYPLPPGNENSTSSLGPTRETSKYANPFQPHTDDSTVRPSTFISTGAPTRGLPLASTTVTATLFIPT